MSDVNVLIKVTRAEQIEIEEYCINAGKKISDYFIELHRAFQKSQPKKAEAVEDWVKDMEMPETVQGQMPKKVKKK